MLGGLTLRKGAGWIKGVLINGLGTVTTAIVLVVIASEKFLEGAWIVLIAIPALVYLTRRIHDHYVAMGEQFSLQYCSTEEKAYTHHSVINSNLWATAGRH